MAVLHLFLHSYWKEKIDGDELKRSKDGEKLLGKTPLLTSTVASNGFVILIISVISQMFHPKICIQKCPHTPCEWRIQIVSICYEQS